MKDTRRTERTVRYAPKFGRLPTEILEQILDYLTIWSLLNLKLTSVMHFVLFRKSFLKNEDYFHSRRDRLFKPEQIGLFKLSWKNLLLRENAQPVLKRDMKKGVLGIVEMYTFLSDKKYYRCTNGFKGFSMKTLSKALREDCPKQFLNCTTALGQILEFIDIDEDRQDNEKLSQAYLFADKTYEFSMGDLAFLKLLPYVMRAGATSCFDLSVRILACVHDNRESEQSLSEMTACLNFDITKMILFIKRPYFMERYFYLLASVYPAGHDEIISVIEKYGEQNQLPSIKNCLPTLSKAHRKALAKTAHETGSESLVALFPNIAVSNRFLAKPKSILITHLSSLLIFLEDNPTPSDLNDFRSKKMLLEIAMKELEQGLSDWDASTNHQTEGELDTSTSSDTGFRMSSGS